MKVSIVTICYNSAKTIEDTIKSIGAQTYPDIEYIIVDGMSTDNTLEIVNRYRDVVTKVICEKDKGISDAFNKGILAATGELIGIVNSDDVLLPETVQYIVDHLDPDTDCIHGNMIVFGGSEVDRDKVVKPNGNYKTLSYCLGSVIHPGSFVRKSAYERYGLFDVHYKSCMDRDLILRMYRSGAKFQYVDKELVRVRRGGVSFTGIKLSLDEGREISLKNGTSPIVANGYYIYHYCKIQLKKNLKRFVHRG